MNFCELELVASHDAFILEGPAIAPEQVHGDVRKEATDVGALQVSGNGRDECAVKEHEVWRLHRKMRKALFVPHSTGNVPFDISTLTGKHYSGEI